MKNGIALRKREIPYCAVLILLLVVLGLLLVPMFILACYDVPAADDFSFSCETHAALLNGDGIGGMIAGAVYKTAEVYYTWQGSFSAIFLMAFQPSVWGFRFYRLTTYIMVVPLISSIFLISHRVFSGIFSLRKSLSGIIAVFAAIICTQFLPAANQAFYWYNGSVYYTFTFSVVLFFFACMIAYLLNGKKWRLVALALMGIIIGGNNYVTALLSLILFICAVLVLAICKKPRWKELLLPLVCLAGAFTINVLAPGNAARQAFFPSHPDPAAAVLLSFRYAAQYALKWLDLRMFAGLLAVFPFLWHAASDTQNCLFRMPVAMTVFSFCVFSSMFTPHVYAIGFDGPGRIQNIYYYAYTLILVFNIFWWLGWIKAKRNRKEKKPSGIGVDFVPVIAFSGAGLICLAASVFFFRGSLTSIAAIGELRNGEAREYYSQALERQGILEDPSVKDCEFSPYRATPYLLYFTDMTEDPDSYENEDTCSFYGKHSIVVK